MDEFMHVNYSCLPLSTGDTIQDPQWLPETVDNTKPYTYYVFSYTCLLFHLEEALCSFSGISKLPVS